MINCQRPCDSWVFSLFFVNFFPFFNLIVNFNFFNTISCKRVKNWWRFASIRSFFGKILCQKRKKFFKFFHFKDTMKIFTDVGKKKEGRNWHAFVWGGGKIGTFGQNIYPCLRLVQTCKFLKSKIIIHLNLSIPNLRNP